MNRTLQIAMIIAMIFYFFCLYGLLKRNKVTLKYSLLWLFTGVIMLIITLFPKLLEIPLQWVGVIEFTNGLFALILFFLIIIVMSLTTIISDMSEKHRVMVQKMSLYEYRLRKIENKEEK